MNKSKKKHKHHYIPVFYLKGFENQNGILYVYSKDKIESCEDILAKNAKSTAFENNGYTLSLPDGSQDSETIENDFKKTEDIAAPLLKKILNGKKLDNKEFDIFIWNFIAPMAIRTPSAKNIFKNILEGLNINNGKQEILESMVYSHEGTVKVLRNVNWNIIQAPDRKYFITSDNPFLSIKFTNNVVNFVLPLSKEFCLIGFYGSIVHKTNINKIVDNINDYIAKFADRQVYYHLNIKDVFMLVKKYV